MASNRRLVARLIAGAGLVLVGATGGTGDGGLPSSPHAVRPILVGEAVPDGALRDGDGKPTSLSERRGGAPAVVVFYRGHW